MTAPRIEIDLSKIRHNTRCLVGRLRARGISVTGVTKAVCGDGAVARAMLDGGVAGLADARITNIERLRRAGITCPVSMIRSPMLSQADRTVRNCDTSYNTEIDVIARLALAAVRAKAIHNIILMVEMGDMREGIMPEHLAAIAQAVIAMPGVSLKGIGANFACLSGLAPEAAALVDLSALADKIEGTCGPFVETVSGGGSASLPWAFGRSPARRINNLRLGEAILLGLEPVSGDPISGLYTDAFTLIAEVIETKIKTKPRPATDPCLASFDRVSGINPTARSILALGHQDTDLSGLTMPAGVRFVGATSDHAVVTTTRSHPSVGSEMKLAMNYGALMRAMAAPDIEKTLLDAAVLPMTRHVKHSGPSLALV